MANSSQSYNLKQMEDYPKEDKEQNGAKAETKDF